MILEKCSGKKKGRGKPVKFKTPYYMIHEQELDENFKKLKDALEKHWNNYIIGYSYKTNALPWVIKHFDLLGCYAETVSEDEYNLAKLIGVGKNHIIYNGPIKTKDSFMEALQNGCIVNIDSQREVEWLEDIEIENRRIGIRINFDMERLNNEGYKCSLDVLGGFEENYSEKIQKYEEDGWLNYQGYQSDIRPFIAEDHCFVLPSWHEGMANTNLECAASGRPIITSNIHGCLEAVIEGKTGFLVKVKNADDLYETMKKFMELSYEEKRAMGIAGREHMANIFDKKKVVEETISYLKNE